MDDFGIETYGERIADQYDELYAQKLPPDTTVKFLADLVGDGRALELGIGTGRVAIPLAALGVRVEGIDASPAMVARLRAKAGGNDIPVHIGNFADVDVEGSYSLIYIPFNTFFALTSQTEQLRCMRNARAHLDVGGSFVIEGFVPDLARFRNNQCTTVTDVGVDSVTIDASIHDPVSQTISTSHLVLTDGQTVRIYPVLLRYVWPAELDAMALASGLRLAERFGDYEHGRFDASSTRHVSVYRPA